MVLLTFIPILLFVNNVSSGIIDENIKRDIPRNIRGTYKYNHPPSAEYFAVPVSVVYEDGRRKEKTGDLDVSTRILQSAEDKTKENLLKTNVEEKFVDANSREISTVSSVTSSKANYSISETTTKAVEINKTNIPKETSASTPKINTKYENKQENDENLTDEYVSTPKPNNQTDSKLSLLTENNLNGHDNNRKEDTVVKAPNIINEKKDKNLEVTNRNNENNESKLRIDEPHDGLIIPVAVVYDVEPEHLRRRHKAVVTVRAEPIARQRNKNTENISKINKKEEIKSVSNENRANEYIRSGIFPKRTQEKAPIVPILQSENYVFSHSGDFHYSYEGGDGTKAFERGELRSDKAGEAVEGSFSYIGKDGKDYSLTYTADENGYRPVGAHLPTPPPIPPAIARALKYLATKPTPETVTESF